MMACRSVGASNLVAGSQVFRGLASTKCVEDTFNLFADEARQHKAGRLGRLARWHRAATGPLIGDFDRKNVVVGNKAKFAAQAASAKAIDGFFCGKEENFSLGVNTLEKITDGRDSPALSDVLPCPLGALL